MLLGIFYLYFVPPLQVPDEYDHFRRVYHLADGHFLPQKNQNRLGGEMPVSFKEYVLPFRHAATNLKYTLDNSHYQRARSVELQKDDKLYDDFPNTSNYSLISYLPQTLAVFIGKSFNAKPWLLYEVGRISAYLVWTICMFFLIRRLQVFKWLFSLLLLLPMNTYLSNSFSADTMTNLLSFAFIGLCLIYAFDKKEITYKRFAVLLLIGIGLSLAKVVYVWLILVFLIIPSTSFQNSKKKLLYFSVMLLVCLSASLLWSTVVKAQIIPYSEYAPEFRDQCCLSHCADFEAQKTKILGEPLYFVKVIYRSLFKHPYTYLAGYIGSFGNNDIPLPRGILYFSYFFILFVALAEKNEHVISVKQKLIFCIASGMSFITLLLSQHLTWDCVGEGIVDVVQGRYLIPLFPSVFLLFTRRGKMNQRYLLFTVFLFVVVIHLSSFKIIYNRYTKKTFESNLEWNCDLERSENNLLCTSNSKILVEGISSLTDSISYSGKYSAKLSPASPFCFTYKFDDIRQGDLIEVWAWQRGEPCQVILSSSGKNCGESYLVNHGISYKGKGGWNRLHYVFTFNNPCSELDSTKSTLFLWNPGKGACIIDDLHFSIKKFGTDYLNHKTTLF